MISRKALFFCNNSLVIDEKSDVPFISFEQTSKYFNIETVIKNNGLNIVQGQLLPEAPFTLVNPKFYLEQLTKKKQQYLLKAVHLISWDSQTKYCSTCGGDLSKIEELIEKKCLSCNKLFFPSLYPAVMVLVYHKNEILLARSPHFTAGVYSALAGFVAIGESAEEAAIREVKEEVGLNICNLEYFGTQTWPFPASFMIAYKAEVSSKKIKIDRSEIEDARWFSKNNLPKLPNKSSISRFLIDKFLHQII